MQKRFLGVLASFMALAAVAMPAHAQTSEIPSSKAGVVPSSMWYGLDIFEEDFHDLVMVRREGKARLGLKHAEERLAEIQEILESDKQDSESLERALQRLRENIQRSTGIVNDLNEDGSDTNELADELSSTLDDQERILDGIMQNQRGYYVVYINDLLKQIQDAQGDQAKIDELRLQLNDAIVTLKNLKGNMGEALEDVVQHRDALEETMTDQTKAAKAMEKARQKLARVQNELTNEGLELPADVLAHYTELMNQADAAYAAGDYEAARNFAKQAKHVISLYEDSLDNEQEDEVENDAHDEMDDNDQDEIDEVDGEDKSDNEDGEDKDTGKESESHKGKDEDKKSSGKKHEDSNTETDSHDTNSDDDNNDQEVDQHDSNDDEQVDENDDNSGSGSDHEDDQEEDSDSGHDGSDD